MIRQAISSNRTFMELKFGYVWPQTWGNGVLIVPLWNWNKAMEKKTEVKACSNRTFMELKSYNRCGGYHQGCVLIVPLWNWNYRAVASPRYTEGRSNRTFMELKWSCSIAKADMKWGSNRTFMELKLLRTTPDALFRVVLIVPLWNWNIIITSGYRCQKLF